MTKAAKRDKAKSVNHTSNQKEVVNPGDMATVVESMSPEAGEIGKIRNILFGTQMADYEHRFATLETRINSQIEDLSAKTTAHFNTIETLIEKQKKALNGRLDGEHTDRIQSAKALSREIADAKDALSQSIDALAAQQAQDIKSVNGQVATISNELSDEIHIQQTEQSKNLEQAVNSLDEDKIARKALSKLLLEMAARLTEDQK